MRMEDGGPGNEASLTCEFTCCPAFVTLLAVISTQTYEFSPSAHGVRQHILSLVFLLCYVLYRCDEGGLQQLQLSTGPIHSRGDIV